MLFRYASDRSTSHGFFVGRRPVRRSLTSPSLTLVPSQWPIPLRGFVSRHDAEGVRRWIQQRRCHDFKHSHYGTPLKGTYYHTIKAPGFCSFTTNPGGRPFTTFTRHAKQELQTQDSTTHENTASSTTTNSDQDRSINPTPVPPRFPSHSSFTSSSSPPDPILQTFLSHASRTGLSSSSTVYTGTVYEYLTASTLCSYGFNLYRVGGRGDRGVDLVGHWHVPLLSPTTGTWKEHTDPDGGRVVVDTETFRVVVQCKRLVGKHAKIGPNLIRELDGTVRAARLTPLFESLFPSGGPGKGAGGNEGTTTTSSNTSTSSPTIGILVGTRPATKGVMDSMRRSNRPLGWIMMEEEEVVVMDRTTDSSLSSPNTNTRNTQMPNTSLDNSTKEQAVSEPSTRDSTRNRGISDTNTDTDTDAEPTRDSASTLDAESSEISKDDRSDGDGNSNAPPPQLRGRVRQILWNQAARNLGLDDVSVVPRYDSSGREEVVLMRGGRVWGGS